MSEYLSTKLVRQGDQRILYLGPGAGHDALNGALSVVNTSDVSSKCSFEAISYVWGSSDKVEVIDTPVGRIPITLSLARALRHYRLTDRPRALWADAICINQNDSQEKSEKVADMAYGIYAAAECVQVYLGEQADESHLAGQLLQRIRTEDWDTERIKESRNEYDKEWSALDHLLRRPWFSRVWVVQEFAMAKQAVVSCGNWSIDAEVLIRVASSFTGEACIPLQNLKDVRRNRIKTQGSGNAPDFLSLLYTSKRLNATLARDHLFAFYSFTQYNELRDFSRFFLPNYDETLEHIVRLYALGFIEIGRISELLHHAGLGDQPDRFPSWIPDWMSSKQLYAVKDPLRFSSHDASKGLDGKILYFAEDDMISFGRDLGAKMPFFPIKDLFSRAPVSLGYTAAITTNFSDFLGLTGKYVSDIVAIGEHGWKSTTNLDEDPGFGKTTFLENADNFLTDLETISGSIGEYPTGEAMNTVLAKSLFWEAEYSEDESVESYDTFKTMARGKKTAWSLILKAVHEKHGSLEDAFTEAGLAHDRAVCEFNTSCVTSGTSIPRLEGKVIVFIDALVEADTWGKSEAELRAALEADIFDSKLNGDPNSRTLLQFQETDCYRHGGFSYRLSFSGVL